MACQNVVTIPILVDESLKLNYGVYGLNAALKILKNNYDLVDSSLKQSKSF